MKENPPHQPGAGAYGGRNTALALAGPYAAQVVAGQSATERLDQTLHVRDLLRIFLKRKWTILIIFAISALFSVVLTFLAPPVYRASTTIQIERFAPRVFDYKEVTPLETVDENLDFYYTNYELLKSRALSERAVEDIGLKKSQASGSAAEQAAKSQARGEAPQPSGSIVQDFLNRLLKGPAPVERQKRVRSRLSEVKARMPFSRMGKKQTMKTMITFGA